MSLPAEYLLEAISREWNKLGRHPNVQIEFSERVDDAQAAVPGRGLPTILVPIPERQPPSRTTDSND